MDRPLLVAAPSRTVPRHLEQLGAFARAMKGEWIKRGAPGAPVVVFVHGILSSGDSAWQHPDGAFWPTIVGSDAALDDVGVYVFSYRTGFFSGSYQISDAVDALKEHTALDDVLSPGGVIFVCHSMGGIVVRRFIVSRATDLIDRGIPIALLLVASPSLGSNYADWLKPLAKLLKHSQADAIRFCQSNVWLGDLDQDFIDLKEGRRLSITGKELIEDRFVIPGWFWNKQVVQPFSGARYFGDAYKVPDSDHFSIAKPAGADAIQHRLLRRFILEWRNGLGAAAARATASTPALVDGSKAAQPRADGAGTEVGAATSTKTDISVVMNFKADFGPDDKARLNQLLASIRAAVGNQDITIEARSGSLLLFLSDPDNALTGANIDWLREALARSDGVHLVGMASIGDFELRRELARMLNAASAELLAWPTSLPNGEKIVRPELATLMSRLNDSSSSATAVLGGPGAGKSALLATLGKFYHDAGWPVLAIKADILDPNIDSEAALRDSLGLYQMPTDLVRTLAKFGPVLLIIDQLDALAGYLDIKTARLSILLNLVRKLGGIDNVHIVMSSRTFEFSHDVRLRAIEADSLMLELPAWDEVLAILEGQGVQAAGWPRDAQEVMRSPQSLSIYLQLGSARQGEPFENYQMMLEQMWQERILGDPKASELDRLATSIAETMADQESLWLARSRYSDNNAEIQALVSAGILATADVSVGFSHQTLFEFALARSFARTPMRLSTFAIERQDSLFLRPKLWAGLTYLRGAERELYYQEIERIWKTPGLRRHLRVLLVDFLGSQREPTDREALLMESALTDDTIKLRAFKAISGSTGWFDRFADSFIANAMRGDEAVANAQLAVLTRSLPDNAAKVIELIEAHWLPTPANDLRAWSVLQWTPTWTADALRIGLTIIGRTDIGNAAIDHRAGEIAVDEPLAALRLVRARLERQLDTALEEARDLAAKMPPPPPDGASMDEQVAWRLAERVRNPVRTLVEQHNDWDSLAGIAEAWPRETLDSLWPWFMRAVIELDRLTDRDHRVGYPLGLELDFRFEGENDLALSEGDFLGALRVAVERFANTDPVAFAAWVKEKSAEDYTPVQRLLAHGIAHRPEQLAQAGLDFVMGDERRYFLGSIHDVQGTTKRMIAAVSPHWTPEEIARFENHVRTYDPPLPSTDMDADERRRWRHMGRRTQLDLLRSLPASSRSKAVTRQVNEAERRYGTGRRGLSSHGAQVVGSIIDAESMAKAKDDDIVNAFVELPDATGWENPRHFMEGGNIQLARAFATFAKEHPDRAIAILERLDKDNGVRAASGAIESLASLGKAEEVAVLVRDVVSRGFDSDDFRNAVARSLDNLSADGHPPDDDLLSLLSGWVTERPIPEAPEGDDDMDALLDDLMPQDATGDAEDATESLLWGYGGSVAFPGGDLQLAFAIVRILLRQEEPQKAVEFLLTYLDREKDLEAWSILGDNLPHLVGADPARLAELYTRVLQEVNGVVGSKVFAQFLAGAQWDHHAFVESQLDAWKNAATRAGRQAYGEIVGLGALLAPEHATSQARLKAILNDKSATDAQAGAALTAAYIFAQEPDRRLAAAKLLDELLALPNPHVWPAMFEVFRITDELIPDDATAILLQSIADGLPRAPKLDAAFVIDRLATLLPHQAVLVGRIAQGLVDQWNIELGDMRTASARATSALVDLAITLHRLGPDTRVIGLSLFEQLIDIDAYEAREMLEEIDNRFRANAPTARRRVRRRSQVSPRRLRRSGSRTPSG